MRIPRIFQAQPLSANSVITLNPETSHYLINVLRLRDDSPLIIFNGEGDEYSAKLINANKKHAVVELDQAIIRDTESPLKIHLGQGIARGERMDFLIQKSIELGVTEITPLFTERSEVKLSADRAEKRLEHWRGIVIAASEQCGRTKLATINPPLSLTAWRDNVVAELKLVLDPDADNSLQQLQLSPQSIAFMIGPEGGLTEHEILSATQHSFTSVRLGPRILRTETAAIATICALQYQWGDLS